MKRKLSAASRRADLISSFEFGAGSAGSAPVALADAASPPASGGGDDNGYQPKPYKADPDETVICPDCQKHNSPDAVYCDQCGFELKGADGVTVEDGADAGDAQPGEEEAHASNGTPPQPKSGEPPVASPTDEKGDVDNGVMCATPDCGHLASAHANTDDGANTGACSTPACACEAMAVESQPNQTDGAGQNEMAAAAAPAEPEPPVEDGALNAPPEMTGGESMGPAFTIPVAVIEGQPTGDGRSIAPGALLWRMPPVPLMGLATATHDPSGFDQNAPAVICGRIDSFERLPGEGETQIICARGYYLPNDDGMYFAELNEAMGRMGVSVDVAVHASEITGVEVDEHGFPLSMEEQLTEGTIMGVTVCPFPAFEGAYVVLGDGSEPPEAKAIPQQTEGPPVMDKPPAAVTAGGQLVHLMTYEECVPCQQGIEVVVASGAGPTRPPKAWFENPNFTEGDGRLVEILGRRGERVVGGKYACPLTATDDGRVYGHLAPWGVCHTGSANQCVVAPRSRCDYSHFKRGQHILTAEGERVRVGVLTADTGHAATRGISASQAMAHYDNTGLACADVNIGEDEYGIWVAGAIRSDATDAQIRNLTAASLSGDWRSLGGQLELVAALAVQQPGFPLAVVAAGGVESLVAAGGGVMHRLKTPVDETPGGDAVLRAALAPMLATSKTMARDRIAALRA